MVGRETSPSRPAGRGLGRSLAAAAIMVLGAAFLARALLRSGEGLGALAWRPSPASGLASLGALACCLAFAPLVWRRILLDLDHRLTYREAFAVYYVSALAKYVPGSIWSYLGVAHYAGRLSLPLGTTVFAMLVQQAVVAAASVLVFAASLPAWPGAGAAHGLGAVAVWAAAVLALRGAAPRRLLEALSARLLRQHAVPRLSRQALAAALALQLASWAFFASGYHFLLQGLYPTSIRTTVAFTGVYAISWLAGFVIIVAPSGLGVRDAAQAYLLSWFMPAPTAAAAALVQRAWLTLGDLATGLAAAWLLGRGRRT